MGGWVTEHLGGLPARVLLPLGYDASKRWPVIVYLHGSGERGSDNRRQLLHCDRYFEDREVRAHLPAIIVAPQCPGDDTWGGPWFGGSSPAQRAVLRLTEELGTRRTVDSSRLALLGVSMGAIGGWEILAKHPGVFSSAALLCGEPDLSWEAKLQGQRIWSFHGEADQQVTIGRARALHAKLPPPARFTGLPGRGHDIWNVLGESSLYRWLLER